MDPKESSTLNLKKVFGQKLKLARLNYGKRKPEFKSQKVFAEKILNIQQDMLSKYETGRVNIPISAIIHLKSIGINLSWFFDTDNPTSEDGIFVDSKNSTQNINYIDYITNVSLKKINALLINMPESERDWIAGYIEGRKSKL